MAEMEPKKLALLRIYQILKESSDEEHPLTQSDIIDELEKNYDIKIARRAVSDNISLLNEAGFEIENVPGKGVYLASREFENSELQTLIDSVICSKYISQKYCDDLVKKLSGLSNKYFSADIKNLCRPSESSKTDNRNLFFNIDMINSAIKSKKKVQFTYNKYSVEKKLVPDKDFKLSPYMLVMNNQKYYVMGFCDEKSCIVYLKLDHITNMKIIKEKLVPATSVPGFEKGIDRKKVIDPLPYMFSDAKKEIKLSVDAKISDQIVDWFGKDVNMRRDPDNPDRAIVRINTSPMAMECWALQYLNSVEVLEPDSLREKIKQDVLLAAAKYQKQKEFDLGTITT